MRGERPPNDLTNRALGAAVGLGHRGGVGLHGDVEAGAVVPHCHLAGGAGRLDRGGQRPVQVGVGHVVSSPGKGSPRSVRTLP